MKRRILSVAGSLLALALHPAAAQDVWQNIVNQYWTNGANWADATAPTNGEVVVFNNQSVPAATDLGGNFTLLSLAVTDAIVPVSISNHTLTMLEGGIDLSTAAQDLAIASILNVATAQPWNVQAGRTLTVRGRVTGNGVASKQGAGALVMRGNDLRTVGTTLAAGETVISGGVFNGAVTLSNGATLVARSGPGLVGEYYAFAPVSNNFDTLPQLDTHLATLNPVLLHNFPAAGTNFDFGVTFATNFPPGIPLTNVEARWVGTFNAPSPGLYTFQTASDDGSMLWIDGTNVVFNNYFQDITVRGGTIGLAAGAHRIEIAYYEGVGGYGFYANVAQPGGPTNRISLADVQTGPALRTLVADPAATITLDETILTLAPAVTMTLSTPVGGSGGLRKIGTFGLALTATNTFAGGLFLQGGTVTVAQAENLGAAGNAMTILGSTLRVTGTALANLDGRALNEDSFSGGFDIADAANVFTVTNALRGRGGLTKLGAGALRLPAENTLSGAVTVAAGTLHLIGSGSLTNATNLVVNGTLAIDDVDSLGDAAAVRLGVVGGARVIISNAVSETIGRLFFDGILQASGTWGASGSGAAHINDTVFGGDGVLNVAVGYDGGLVSGSWSTSANGNWSDTNNWVGQVYAQGTNNTAYFTNALTADRTVTEDIPNLPLGGMVFGSPTNNWTVNNGTVELAVNAGTPSINVATNTATVGATFYGTQGLAKVGAGTLVLTSVTNRYSGTTSVDAGTLSLTGAGSLYSGGASAGAVVVNSGGTLNFGRSDTYGAHTAQPLPSLTINAGGVVQNSGGLFNTLGPVALSGGELRSAGGSSAQWFSWQVRGTVPVTGATPSRITGTKTANGFVHTAIGNNLPGGSTTFDVADVTLNADADLLVSSGFADSRTLTGAFTAVASSFVKTGPGTVLNSGNNLNTGPNRLDAGTMIVSGGVFNGAVVLSNGTTLVATEGEGLVGEYYYFGAVQPLANFNNVEAMGDHFAPLNANLLYNGPATGTNVDFGAGGANFPPSMQTVNLEARYTATFLAPVPGVYTFQTASDDGSMLWIDGTNVVANNFSQPTTTRSGTIGLAAGPHTLVLGYNQGGGGYGLFVNVAMPGGATNRLPLAMLRTGPAIAGLAGEVGSSVVITNTTLSVVITNNTSFPGTLAGNGVLRKLGAGTWTLTGTNTQTGNIISGGRLVYNSSVHLGGPTAGITLDGGTLEIQDPTVLNLDTHPVNWPTFNGGLDMVNAGSILTVTSFVGSGTATGNLTKFGPGGLTLTRGATLGRGLFRGGHTELSATEPTVFQNFISLGFGAGERATVAVSGLGALTSSNDLNIGDTSGSTGIVTVSGSAALLARSLYLGKNGQAAGALHLLDGQVLNYAGSGNEWRIGGGAGTNDALAYGYFRQLAGVAKTDRNLHLGAYGRGVYDLVGGTWSNYGGTPVIGRFVGSHGVLNVSGGIFIYTNAGNRILVSEGGYGVLNQSGGRVTSISGLNVGGFTVSYGTGVVNLAGGEMEVGFITQNTNASFGVFNFMGGTLRAMASTPTFMQSLDAAYVWPGGAVVDAGPYAITIAQDLLTPPGTGVVSLVLTNGGSGYIGPPLVVFAGGGGTGATAVAEVDLTAGVVTNVRVTNPGVNYDTAPVVTLVGGAGVGAGVGVPVMGANTGGGFVKLGSGSLKLTGTNTFAGNIVISNGVFLVGSTNITGGLELAGTNIGIGGAFNVDQSFLTWLAGKMVGSNPAQLAIGANTTNDLDLTAAPWAGLPIISGGGTESFSGGLTTGSTNLHLGGTIGTLVWARVVGTGTNVFIGYAGGQTSGVVTLSGTNVGYASEINVLSGNLRVGSSNGLGGAAARVVVADGAALDVNGLYAGDMPIYVVGRGPHGNGAIVNTGPGTIPNARTVHLTGDTTFGGPNRWDIRAATTGPLLNLAGFTLTKTNANELAAFNCEVTDGNLIVGQGLFRFEQNSPATAGVGRITVGPSGTLDFYNLLGAVTRPITVTGGIIRAGANVANVGSPITLAGPTNTFDCYPGTTLVLTGLVDGVGTLRKLNVGTLRLLQTEAYTGETIVNAGVLTLEAGNSLDGTIGSSSGLIVNNGGLVRVTANDALFGAQARPVTISAGGTLLSSNASSRLTGPLTLFGGALDGSAPDAMRGNWKLETAVNVLSNAAITASRVQLGVATGTVFDVATGRTLVVASTFENPDLGASGTGMLVKAGAGTMTILATNSYSGPTRVLAGTLRLRADAPPAGASLWLDASDLSTITADGSAKVAAWNDKSGNARHATQTNAAVQPTLFTNAIPGRPVMRFAGNSQQMDLNLSFLANSPYTILGVEARTNTGTIFMLGTRSNATNAGLHFGYRNNTAFTLAQYANDLDAGISGYTGQVFRLWNGTLDTVVGHSVFLNGTNLSSNANTTPFAANLGPGVVGAGHSGGNFLGDVGEVLVYNRALSAADRKLAETYLMNKWLGGAPLADLLPAASPLQVAAGATLDLGGVRQTVGSLSDLAGGGGNVLNHAVGAAVLILGQDGSNAAFSGVIRNGTGTVAVVKTGAGTQSLHGLNPFGGGTTISNGTLLVNGSIGTGSVTVAGGTLGGTGVVLGAVNALVGVVSPGLSAGRLTISNDYQQTAGGTLLIELGGTTAGSGYDELAVGGTAMLGGTLMVITNGSFAPGAGHTFVVLAAGGGLSGTFAATNLPGLVTGLGWDVQYPANTVVLTVTGTVASASAYELWAASIVNPALRGEQEDPDGDGYANLLEYSQGSDATNASDNAKLMLLRTNGQFLAAFNRVNTATDIVYEVEGAYAPTNGAEWLGIATNVLGSWGSSTNVNDNNTAAVHQVWVTDLEIGTNRSLRLKVTRP